MSESKREQRKNVLGRTDQKDKGKKGGIGEKEVVKGKKNSFISYKKKCGIPRGSL